MLTCAAAAIQCLKRKRLYEQQIEQLGNFQLRIHDQVCLFILYLLVFYTFFFLKKGVCFLCCCCME